MLPSGRNLGYKRAAAVGYFLHRPLVMRYMTMSLELYDSKQNKKSFYKIPQLFACNHINTYLAEKSQKYCIFHYIQLLSKLKKKQSNDQIFTTNSATVFTQPLKNQPNAKCNNCFLKVFILQKLLLPAMTLRNRKNAIWQLKSISSAVFYSWIQIQQVAIRQTSKHMTDANRHQSLHSILSK